LTAVAASDATRGTVLAAPKARPWRRAILWGAFLAPFFYLTYGGANWIASLRAGVPSVVFDWERAIPFLDWTIVPYWSINVFYGLSLLVCATQRELDTHARRLVTAQVVAIACFILFPLRFTFVQPETNGVFGVLFAALTSFDKPFNQAPSLHIALLVILWDFYARHLPGRSVWLLHGWFVLVGASVLTTYQHHFIDIPTGALLGFLCLWAWPMQGPSPLSAARSGTRLSFRSGSSGLATDPRRRRLALRYAAGAAATVAAAAALAFAIGGIALWLLWPAVALLLVAANYALLGADGFQKAGDGRMSIAVRALLAPYWLGALVNSRLWTRHEPRHVAIRDGVALGRIPSVHDSMAFATVVDLAAELPATAACRCRAFPTLDLVPPDPWLLAEAAHAIEDARGAGPVLVCCALGFSRSAAAVATWLVATGRASDAAEAVEQIRAARPRIVLDAAALAAIEAASRPHHADLGSCR
jgi:hypothetical protein